jgi:MYXO-CTERM domain-containing protein
MRIARFVLAALTACTALSPATEATAESFLVVKDLEGHVGDPEGPSILKMRKFLLAQYAEAGLELPEIFSVWTSFPMNGNVYATYIDPRANDVTGIGFEDVFPPTGLKTPSDPPLRAILWHNDFTAMDQRASLHRSDAAASAYTRYLFLLELSHLWGPDIRVPDPDPSQAIGFSFHWSFFLDRPGPAGGNTWTDNGDGTYTVVPGDPATVRFSDLDLYLMGLAEASEVAPFQVLEPTDVPTTPTDPFWGGAHSERSFPWFDATNDPLTVTATTRSLTADDVIAANGERTPAAGEKTSFTLGVVLMVPGDATDAEIATASEAFEPVAAALPGHFDDATQGRGTLELVTVIEPEPMGGGGAGGAPSTGGAGGAGGEPASGGAGGAAADEGGGCDCTTASSGGVGRGWVLAALAGLVGLRRRRAARRWPDGADA